MHGRGRAEIDPFVEGPRVDLIDRQVAVRRLVEEIQHRHALGFTERVGWTRSNDWFLGELGLLVSVEGGADPTEQLTRPNDADEWDQRLAGRPEQLIDDYSVSAFLERLSKSACAFPTMSSASRVRSSSVSSC